MPLPMAVGLPGLWGQVRRGQDLAGLLPAEAPCVLSPKCSLAASLCISRQSPS